MLIADLRGFSSSVDDERVILPKGPRHALRHQPARRHAQLLADIRDLDPDDQRRRNERCWFAVDC